MPEHLIVVHTTTGAGPATIVKDMLAAAGIPAILSQEGAGAAYGLTVGPLGLVDVLVPAGRAAEAQALIAAMLRGEMSDDG